MQQPSFEHELARERRARLAAERLLDQKQKELKTANRKLSEHALNLSGQIVDQRRVVQALEGQNTKVNQDLEKANDKIVTVERLLWTALETIEDGFALFDADFRMIAGNRPYRAAFEYADFMVPGVNYETILDHYIDEGIIDLEGRDEEEWFDMMISRWSTRPIEAVVLRFWDGRSIKMMDRHTADGGIVTLALDITDSINREQEMRLARDKAEAADRAKSAFLAKMSHELRTPMNGVVGMADLLIEGEEDEERLLYATTIRNSGEALLEIINDVLDFSKIEADKLELKPKPFDLEQIIQEVSLIVEPTVHQKGLEFCVDYDQFLPTGFIGDPGRIRQIITNLVGNAVKFTENGHVMVRVVGITSDDETSCMLHITVEDTGIGIDADKVDHVFGEFNQVEDDANRKYEGTGLGLAISRKLIEQMDGDVWLESEKGEGSCFGFSIELPLVGDAPMPESSDLGAFNKAVIVDQQRMESQILVRQLESLGIECWTFDDIEKARGQIAKPDCDLVFLSAETEPVPEVRDKTIWISRAPDGAEAPVVLPVPVLRNSLREVLGGLNIPAPPPEKTRDRPVVLAAEDNKTNQLVFRKMLKNLDLELVLVGNGVEAVASFKELSPDIVFMDISMPEMDGMDATRAIRDYETAESLARVPVIAMTAHAMDGDKDRILAAGLDHYLTKPLKKDLIHGALRDNLPNYAENLTVSE